MRVADFLARRLKQAGVAQVFSLSGNQIMPIYDACIDADIRIVHTRHEAAAVFMADACAQLTGGLGVALVTAAPGFGNALGPLYSARCAESPVLLLSGDSPVAQDGKGAFQELDQVAISTSLTKLSLRPRTAESVGPDLERAMRTARSGRPGPVHLALPFDVLNQMLDEEASEPRGDPEPAGGSLDAALVQRIGETLAKAERPLVLTGPSLSASRTGGLLSELEESLAAPVLCMESPRGLKDPSLGDLAKLLPQADRVVLLGKVIDFTLAFGKTPPFDPACRLLVVDPEEAALARARQLLGERAELLEQADVKALAAALCELSPSSPDRRQGWRGRVAEAVAARGEVPADAGDKRIHPAVLCRAVQRVLSVAEDPVLVCDGGEFGQWAQGYIDAPTRIINGVSGAIGGGPCYALAARLCRPEATVIALMGDGTVGFHLSEFETALRCGAPFVAVIGHDARWNAEVQIQMREYGADRLIGCQLQDTRYDLVVQGLGGHGEFVDDPAELEPALQRALACGRPACVNVRIQGLPAPAGAGH